MKKCIDCKKEVSRDNKKGRCKTCYLSTQKGIGNNNYKHGNDCKDKKHYCFDCQCEITRQAIRCSSCETKRQFKEGILNNKGPNHGNWNNGSSFLPYPPKFNNELRELNRDRDNYTCQNCGMTEEEHIIVIGQVLHVHHIDYNKENCEESNLLTLCFWCNIRANTNRSYWQSFYQNKKDSLVSF